MASPGLELLFNSIKSQFNSCQDALIAVFHWELISKGFKCLGNGEEKPSNATEKGSESLPEGWNTSPNYYVMRYSSKNDKEAVYILKVIRIDEDLLVHFMKAGTDVVESLNVRTSDYSTGSVESYDGAYTQLDELCALFKSTIVDAVVKPQSSSQPATSQQRSRDQRSRLEEDDPLRVPPRRPPQRAPGGWNEPDDPFSIGRGDLDPFAAGRGGGMIFDPMRTGVPGLRPDPSAGLPHRLPPGAVPPGARFDPFGPPGQRPGPDPDHMPPPGYDDMFM
ncbi:proteasome inhibitor PI31 subunit-like [Ostrea edulis]|uniref:proteasome inhibitor PI31 subunit-like n=1 Tax=Ostrea edulis TaxID=37623 RepID=UPI0024AEA277|nr:proteasome inhibitor PI31 subunit-like [Ostrea edulis]